MRLNIQEVQTIKAAVARLDKEAKIFLFGSRIDPSKKGGDIDLLILSKYLEEIDSIAILKRIYEQMDEQKIDILIAKDDQEPFVQLALSKSIQL